MERRREKMIALEQVDRAIEHVTEELRHIREGKFDQNMTLVIESGPLPRALFSPLLDAWPWSWPEPPVLPDLDTKTTSTFEEEEEDVEEEEEEDVEETEQDTEHPPNAVTKIWEQLRQRYFVEESERSLDLRTMFQPLEQNLHSITTPESLLEEMTTLLAQGTPTTANDELKTKPREILEWTTDYIVQKIRPPEEGQEGSKPRDISSRGGKKEKDTHVRASTRRSRSSRGAPDEEDEALEEEDEDHDEEDEDDDDDAASEIGDSGKKRISRRSSTRTAAKSAVKEKTPKKMTRSTGNKSTPEKPPTPTMATRRSGMKTKSQVSSATRPTRASKRNRA